MFRRQAEARRREIGNETGRAVTSKIGADCGRVGFLRRERFWFCQIFPCRAGVFFFVFVSGRFFPVHSAARRFSPSALAVGGWRWKVFRWSSRAIGDGLAHDVADLRDLVNAHERVHFGQELGQFVAEALRQAAGNDDGLAAPAASRSATDSRMVSTLSSCASQ
jgi:hypothetical protein